MSWVGAAEDLSNMASLVKLADQEEVRSPEAKGSQNVPKTNGAVTDHALLVQACGSSGCRCEWEHIPPVDLF